MQLFNKILLHQNLNQPYSLTMISFLNTINHVIIISYNQTQTYHVRQSFIEMCTVIHSCGITISENSDFNVYIEHYRNRIYFFFLNC